MLARDTSASGLPEIARRHDRLQAAMADARLQAVVIAGNTEFQQKGYIRYYAGWRLHGGTAYLVVTPDREPALILGLGAQAEWARELGAIADTRAVLDKIGEVCATLSAIVSPGDRVGIVGLGAIVPHGDAQRLVAALPYAAISDATDLVEALWCLLSPSDLRAVEEAHACVAQVFEAFREGLRPERSELEIVADAYRVAIQAGCLEGMIHLNCDNKSGTRPASARIARQDDIYKMFMEFLTPQGYLIELGGCFSFKPPPPAWQRKFDVVASAIGEAIAGTRPGMVADEVVTIIRRTYEAAGLEIVGRRLWDFHGQGMHSLLRPFGLPGSHDQIGESMMINIHPGLLTSDGLGISATSNYVVTPGGGRPLGGFVHKWHIVGDG